MKFKYFIGLLIIFIFAGATFSFECRTLPNGQTVVVEQVKNNPIVIIDTWVKTGSINEDDKNSGVSHFLEHLLFKGSKNYPTGEFDRILESKGGIVNAATSKDFTHFYIQLPSKYFDTALNLHSDMLLYPSIPDIELEKERKVVIEEISKDLNSPEKKVYENFTDALYTNHPYKRKVIGNEDVISNISKKEILDYYKKYYVPQNMITVVIGDVEPEYAFEKIQEKFNLPQRKLKKNINPKEKYIQNKIVKIDYQPVNSGYMIIGYRVPDIRDNDNYALDVLSVILGEGRSSVFYKQIKEKQLAFDIDATNSTYKEDGMFYIDANFMSENLDKLQNAIYKEIENVSINGISKEQLELAKKIIETETKYSREAISSISSQIGYTAILSDGTDYYDNYLKNINKVSVLDVQKAAKMYLKENNSVVSIVLPQEYKNFPIKNEVNKSNHTYKFVREADGIKKYTLDNKATLLINSHNSNDIVAISIYAKGGSFLEKIPATSNLTASVMLSGTLNYSKSELSKIMEENGIKINPQVTSDAFAINLVTTKSQLSKALEILNEIVNNAVFDEKEIEKAKAQKLSFIKKAEDVPQNRALNGFREMLFENSAYFSANSNFIKNYPKIQKQDILDYYKSIFGAQNIVISINGNVKAEDVINPLSEIFSQNKINFEYSDKLITDIKTKKSKIQTMKNLGTGWIFTGWQTCGGLNEKDAAVLYVINSILGSGMSSRLFVDLREKEGLAYQIGSSYSPKLLKGSFVMYIGTNQKFIEKAKKLMFNEIERLKKEKVSDKELQEAKDKIIGRYILSQETNLDKASQTGWFEASSRGFDFGKKYEKLIYNVTPEDILRIANKYFTGNNILSIIKEEK